MSTWPQYMHVCISLFHTLASVLIAIIYLFAVEVEMVGPYGYISASQWPLMIVSLAQASWAAVCQHCFKG